jgi:hypothetical protein
VSADLSSCYSTGVDWSSRPWLVSPLTKPVSRARLAPFMNPFKWVFGEQGYMVASPSPYVPCSQHPAVSAAATTSCQPHPALSSALCKPINQRDWVMTLNFSSSLRRSPAELLHVAMLSFWRFWRDLLGQGESWPLAKNNNCGMPIAQCNNNNL